MTDTEGRSTANSNWPAMAGTALRVAFGMIWLVSAALTFSPDFANHYVGYLHNAATGQPAWSAWWFNLWIALVTPNVTFFVWATRIAEVLLALALIFGIARKFTYIVGLLFSLLIWSTAEGFGGPYSVGASNIGAGLSYVLIFAALIDRTPLAGVAQGLGVEPRGAPRAGAAPAVERAGPGAGGGDADDGTAAGRPAQRPERAFGQPRGGGGGGVAAVTRLHRPGGAGARRPPAASTSPAACSTRPGPSASRCPAR